jgi:hypothetical protein
MPPPLDGGMNYDKDMPPYIQDMADWLDDPKKVHPCNFESAWKGFEILSALCRSAALGGQVALPLTSGADQLALLRAKVPEAKVHLASRQPASPPVESLTLLAREWKKTAPGSVILLKSHG